MRFTFGYAGGLISGATITEIGRPNYPTGQADWRFTHDQGAYSFGMVFSFKFFQHNPGHRFQFFVFDNTGDSMVMIWDTDPFTVRWAGVGQTLQQPGDDSHATGLFFPLVNLNFSAVPYALEP